MTAAFIKIFWYMCPEAVKKNMALFFKINKLNTLILKMASHQKPTDIFLDDFQEYCKALRVWAI